MTAEGFTERREMSLGGIELEANIHPLSVLGNNLQLLWLLLLSTDVLESDGNLCWQPFKTTLYKKEELFRGTISREKNIRGENMYI